ncbi:unnamed protein product, partial [Polarella glacialis]
SSVISMESIEQHVPLDREKARLVPKAGEIYRPLSVSFWDNHAGADLHEFQDQGPELSRMAGVLRHRRPSLSKRDVKRDITGNLTPPGSPRSQHSE